MIPPSDEPPLSEEDIVLALRNYSHELQTAQIEFEELWHATGQGEQLPDKQSLKRLLGSIQSRAELMELAFTSLRVMRAYPDQIKPKCTR